MELERQVLADLGQLFAVLGGRFTICDPGQPRVRDCHRVTIPNPLVEGEGEVEELSGFVVVRLDELDLAEVAQAVGFAEDGADLLVEGEGVVEELSGFVVVRLAELDLPEVAQAVGFAEDGADGSPGWTWGLLPLPHACYASP
ncbi:MAG: hypothetical protein AAF467_27860, partial [Actinomycetota bacterium]